MDFNTLFQGFNDKKVLIVGDAMIVMWPRAKGGDVDGNEADENVTVIRKAI
jgi:hypothetical protein